MGRLGMRGGSRPFFVSADDVDNNQEEEMGRTYRPIDLPGYMNSSFYFSSPLPSLPLSTFH